MVARTVVVGGGLAGLAAATLLAESGAPVTVVEERSRLGGATFSFPRGELTVDNGQHVLLRCYGEYLAMLRRWGTAGEIDMQTRFAIPVQDRDGRRHLLARTPGLPAPLHLAPALARYGPVPARDRVRLLRAVLALRGLNLDDPALDAQSFGTWLRRAGQSRAAVEALWNLITVAALNAPADDASLSLCAMVFRTALLDRADAADIGVPRASLQRLHGDAAAAYLRARGADVRTDTPVRRVEVTPDGFLVRTGGAALDADRVVVAVPARRAAALLPTGALDVAPDERTSPIVNVHVVYDRPVVDAAMLAFLGSPVQWVFDRSGVAGVTPPNQYLAVSVSAAGRWIDEPSHRLRATFLPELGRLLPRAASARAEQFFVTRERHATFRQAPETAGTRAPPRTAVPGLALAGAWTATGWPDTMEGAVRSGTAAAAVLDTGTALRRERRIAS